MQNIIFTYGAITGLIIILTMTLGIYAAQSGADSFFASETLGYTIMIIGFSTIFVATKKYRDDELGGVIKFGSAFKVGIGISLIAGIVYVIVWEINLFITDYAFINEYTATIIENARNSGVSEAELQATIDSMETMKENYENVFFRLPMTFTEIFPIGLLISLISAGIFRNPNFLTKE